MAKTMEDIRESRIIRQALQAKWGGWIPSSIWETDRAFDKSLFKYDLSYGLVASQRTAVRYRRGDFDAEVAKVVTSANFHGRGDGGGVSLFPYDLTRKAVLFYTELGERVLDPFAGHNSRMQAVLEQGRNYVGYDVCKVYMEFNHDVLDRMKQRQARQFFSDVGEATLRQQSSEHMKEADASIDFVFTSPPYWDMEFYDNHPDQLGTGKTYEQFLAGLRRVITECGRVLKPGRFCVFNVNDFRKDGRFYSYHTDVIRLFSGTDLILWDTGIIVWPGAFKCQFATWIRDHVIFGKRHEYLLVFRKKQNL